MNETSPALKRILGADCCAGCGLCASIAPDSIRMEASGDGFARPVQRAEVSLEADRLIAENCPGVSIRAAPEGARDHVLWGPIIASRTGYAMDADLRRHASSGGVISALVIHLLESGRVDSVLQVSASAARPIENETVRNSTPAGVKAAAGSRYAPSSPLEALGAHLDLPGTFALVGKPCDIAAARAMARTDPRIDRKIPFMISFFCAGIPSRRGTERILAALGVEEAGLKSFRYRGDGWPGFATAETADGKKARMSYADSWGGILSKHVQFRCKICPDGSGGQADVVCADAWECDENGFPVFEEVDGRSLILTRTEKGEALVREAVGARAIETVPFPVEEIETVQPSQARRKREVFARTLAMRILNIRPPIYTGLNILKAAWSGGLVRNARSFGGSLRRLLARRAHAK